MNSKLSHIEHTVEPAARHKDLLRIIDLWADKNTGDCLTPINGLTFFRRDKLAAPHHCMVQPSIVVLAQGAKLMRVGDAALPYDPTKFLIVSLDVPAISELVSASQEHPCLGLSLTLDVHMLAELFIHTSHPTAIEKIANYSVGTAPLSSVLWDPIIRLVSLLDEPSSIPILAPLALREIHYRLLLSEQAPLLRQIVSTDAYGQRVARAINWLKEHFAKPFRIDDLAGRVQMSPSTFHQHFRQLTSMSPLQYQKWLRLNEARRLMLSERLDASSAAYQVGYESPSQFSREYGRLFGSPPKKDIGALLNPEKAAQKATQPLPNRI
ncbi:AraC family transcriptional regulator [Pantoea sp. Tr-811]|uniref:AraC family transcriptional regulator n=1 Tax=Pantoea sp. Tr-811 TaxID=2608361 RepID=UPI00141EAE21|nr:AraC family transcriptional regulator [Pantoea sp. Tr-811]NIF24761.1 AraC family transcriptional regulator [Pantoea sp. Tr-811]